MESFGSHNASPAGHYAPHAGHVAANGAYATHSPTRFGTPNSATHSTEAGSPRLSGVQSPTITAQQQQSSSSVWQNGGAGRRLSVPSAANPFQPPPPGIGGHPAPFLSPLGSSTASAFSTNTSAFASPTSSIFSESRNDSISAAEAEWRRRTWHSGSYAGQRPATSGVGQYQRLGSPRPAFAPLRSGQAAQVTRLPGIESFDQVPPQLPSSAMSRHGPSPARAEGASAHVHSHSVAVPSASQYGQTHRIHHAHHPPRSTEHPNLSAWEMPLLHRGLNRLDIANNNGNSTTTSTTTSNNNSNSHGGTAAASTTHSNLPYRHHHSHSYTPGMFCAPQHPLGAQSGMYNPSSSASNTPPTQFGASSQRSNHQESSQSSTSIPSEPPVTPRKIKRLGWYNGPLASSPPGSSNSFSFAPTQQNLSDVQMQIEQQQQNQSRQQQQQQQASPEDSTSSSDSVPTPSSHSMMETDPAIIHSNGTIDGPHGFNGPAILQREGTKTAASIGLPNHPPAPDASAGYFRKDEVRPPAFSLAATGQGYEGHRQLQRKVGSFDGAGTGNGTAGYAQTSTPSFDLGFGPGPVEYSSSSQQQEGGAGADDTRRLEALVAVATRDESDEMRT